MKNKYIINNKKSKRFILLLTGLFLFFSCKDLNDLNPIKGSIKNQLNENLFVKELSLINPSGELISPYHIIYSPTEIKYLFELDPENLKGIYELHYTYSNGTNKISKFKYKDIEASATSSPRRSKRFVPLLISGLVGILGVSIIKIGVEAVFTPKIPALVPSAAQELMLTPAPATPESPQDSPPQKNKTITRIASESKSLCIRQGIKRHYCKRT